jgi:hypothetical protein
MDTLRIAGTGVVDGAGMFLLECTHTGNQASSPEEVAAIEALVQRILVPGALWTDRAGETKPLTANDVLVIAPYNAQVSALRRALLPLGITHIGTVDKFQGQEAPIVIYSCTSSSPQDAPRGLAFLYDPHRLNVASSRARGAFVMVASPQLFAPEVKTPEQMRWANGMCRFREVAKGSEPGLTARPRTDLKRCSIGGRIEECPTLPFATTVLWGGHEGREDRPPPRRHPRCRLTRGRQRPRVATANGNRRSRGPTRPRLRAHRRSLPDREHHAGHA